MSRVITKPSDIRPLAGWIDQPLENKMTKGYFLSLDEAGKMAKAYGDERAKKAEGYQSNAEAWESLFNSPEWGGKG